MYDFLESRYGWMVGSSSLKRINEELPVIRQPSLGTNSECRIHFGRPIHVTVLNHNINANWVWRSRELEDQARKDGLIYLAKCWVYKRRHPGGQNGNPG